MKSHKSILQSIIVISIIIIFVSIAPISSALADTTGPKSPGTGTNQSGFGSEAWQNPGNITTPGSPYSTVALYKNHQVSNYLEGTDYGFSIPAQAIITGIELQINRRTETPNFVDSEVRMVKGGDILGENKAITTTWTTTFTLVTYGGPTDLWGLSWLPADVNSLNFGAVLAAQRTDSGTSNKQAIVDSMRITVFYATNSTTAIVCGNGSLVVYGDNLTCTATVTSLLEGQIPTGTVNWISDGSGSFTPNPCTLADANGVQICTATYTPSAVGSGTHKITATYSGDAIFDSSNASQNVTVAQRPLTVTADPKTKVYGQTDPALTYQITAGSIVFSDAFTGSLTRQPGENVGQYAILQGSLALPVDYSLTYVGNSLTITKADATCLIVGFSGVYDAAIHGATGSCTGIGGENPGTIDYGATFKNVPGGSAHWVLTGNGNYNNQSGDVSIVINKADANCIVSGYTVTYDAAAHSASGSCNGVGGENAGSLNPGASYTNVPGGPAHWIFTGNGNYNDQNGDVNIVINKANALCTIIGFSGAYDAVSHGATGTCTGVGGETAGILDLGASYTNVPGGTAHWSFTGNGNYNNQSGDASIVINKANAVCVVTPYLVEYDRLAHTAAGTCTGVLDDLLSGLVLTGTTHTQIGVYPADPWTFTDSSGNYNNVVGSVNDEITKRMITVTADAKTKAFGHPDPALTFHVTSGTLLEGDSFSGALIRQPGESAGTYPILQGSLSLPLDYYVITYVRANLTITVWSMYLPFMRR